jgi:hypothetical protein
MGNGFVPPSPRFASGPSGKPEGMSSSYLFDCGMFLRVCLGEGLDEWFHDLSKFEGTLVGRPRKNSTITVLIFRSGSDGGGFSGPEIQRRTRNH